MGEWYDYNVRFVDKEENIYDRLIADGYAVKEQTQRGEEHLRLFIDKIDEAIKDHDLSKAKDGHFLGSVYIDVDHMLSSITIGFGVGMYDRTPEWRNSIYYVNKFVPNMEIPLAVSALYPDRIIETSEITPYYSRSSSFYTKDGKFTNRDGKESIATLYGINPNFIKEPRNGSVVVSLPIGSADDKWGIFMVPISDIAGAYLSDGSVENNTVFLTKENVEIFFKNSKKTYEPKELVNTFYNAIGAYRDHVREQMILENIPEENMQRRGDDNNVYYIVKLHVSSDISENGILSITVPSYNISDRDGESSKNINLGDRIKERNCRIITPNPDGRTETVRTVRMTNEKIKEACDAVPQRSVDEEEEEDIEMT